MATKYMTLKESAQTIRTALKQNFPGQIFSVKSRKYAGGCNITVSWDNGPTYKQVEDVIGKMHGAEFDGMEDLKTYNQSGFANDYLHLDRTLTDGVYLAIFGELTKRYSRIGDLNLAGAVLDLGYCVIENTNLHPAEAFRVFRNAASKFQVKDGNLIEAHPLSNSIALY